MITVEASVSKGWLHKNGGFSFTGRYYTELGAEFSFFEDKDADVTGRPLENISDVSELPSPESILTHPLIKDLENQMGKVRDTRPDLRIIPPFFGMNPDVPPFTAS